MINHIDQLIHYVQFDPVSWILVEDVEAALVEVAFAHLAAHVEGLQADAVVDASDRKPGMKPWVFMENHGKTKGKP